MTRPMRPGPRAVAGLLVCQALVLLSSACAAPAPPVSSSIQLYVSVSFEQWDPWRARRLHPETLADLGEQDLREISPGRWGRAVTAADNGMSANALPDGEIVIHESAAATERLRIRLDSTGPSVADHCLRISQDGTRIARYEPGARGTPAILQVLSTKDGSRISSVPLDEPSCASMWIDPALLRAYRIGGPRSIGRAAGTVRLVGFDLASGAEAGRMELTPVRAGAWTTGQLLQPRVPGLDAGQPVTPSSIARHDFLSPAVAFSPDGRRFAIVHADSDTVTSIDAERLVVERTIALDRHLSFFDRWLPRLGVAHAKVVGEGVYREAVFGPDGRSLYLFGWATRVDQDDGVVYRGLGLQRVDLDRGAIVAEALAEQQAKHVLPSPDGMSLYVLSSRETATPFIAQEPYWLRRVDARTLAVQAEREFSSYRLPWVRPSPANFW